MAAVGRRAHATARSAEQRLSAAGGRQTTSSYRRAPLSVLNNACILNVEPSLCKVVRGFRGLGSMLQGAT